jgi:hypothetical protein
MAGMLNVSGHAGCVAVPAVACTLGGVYRDKRGSPNAVARFGSARCRPWRDVGSAHWQEFADNLRFGEGGQRARSLRDRRLDARTRGDLSRASGLGRVGAQAAPERVQR